MYICIYVYIYMEVSWNRDTPKSSTLMGFSLINRSFGGTPIYGNPHLHQRWKWRLARWPTAWWILCWMPQNRGCHRPPFSWKLRFKKHAKIRWSPWKYHGYFLDIYIYINLYLIRISARRWTMGCFHLWWKPILYHPKRPRWAGSWLNHQLQEEANHSYSFVYIQL